MKSLLFAFGCVVVAMSSHAWAASLTFGQTVTGSISSAAQSNSYTFIANAKDVADFTMVTTSGKLVPKIQLYNPDSTLNNSAYSNQPFACGGSGVEMNTIPLPQNGTYTLIVSDCSSTNTGNYTIYVQRTNNPSGAAVLLIGGQPQAGSISSATQSNSYTFPANAKDIVDFTLVVTSGSLVPKIRLYNPDGSLNSSAYSNQPFACGGSSLELNTVTLPTTGNYTVLIGDCGDTNSGNYLIYAQRTNNPNGAVILHSGGQPQPGSIDSTALSNTYTFAAYSSDVVDFTMVTTGGTLVPKIRIYNPDGTLNSSAYSNQPFACGGSTLALNTSPLPQTGTYTVLVGDCGDTNTGTYNLSAQCIGSCPTPVTHVFNDFAGNGRSGALLYDSSLGQSYTAISNGDGTYQYVPNLFTTHFNNLVTGDYNGDGKADLILYNSQTALAYIGMGNGDGTFNFQSLFWSPTYNIVGTGEINGDGKTDVVLYNSTTGTLYTGISNGDGTFTYQYHLVSMGFTYVGLGNFTGSGKAGLLLYNSATGLAFLGVGDGTGNFTFNPLSVSPGYSLVSTGDLNGDGKTDVILYNPANGNTATGISDGMGGFAFTPQVFSPGFTSVRLAYYTGSRKADVTVYNKNNALAYFGTGNGDGTFNFQSLFWSPGYDYVVPEDVNADGKTDVVLYNSATGTQYTGISNGNGTFSYTYWYWGIGRTLAR